MHSNNRYVRVIFHVTLVRFGVCRRLLCLFSLYLGLELCVMLSGQAILANP